MTPAQIADQVRLVGRPDHHPSDAAGSATGKGKPSRIVGSGFMATKNGVIVTSLGRRSKGRD